MKLIRYFLPGLFLLFIAYPVFGQAIQAGNQVQLIERDFGIPAHPAPGDRKISHRFPSGSTVTIEAIDSETGWIKAEDATGHEG